MGRRFFVATTCALVLAYGCSSFEADVVTTPSDGGMDSGLDASGTDEGSADGACGSTASDPSNCGACGHSCLGGTCESGKCREKQIAATARRAAKIAETADAVYFVDPNGNELWKCPFEGCATAPTKLVPLNDTRALVRDGQDLIVLTNTAVERVTPQGGVTKIADGFVQASDMGLPGDGYLYWRALDSSTMRILRTSIANPGIRETFLLAPAPDFIGTGKKRVAFTARLSTALPDELYICDGTNDCAQGRKLASFTDQRKTTIALTDTHVFFARFRQVARCSYEKTTGCDQSPETLVNEASDPVEEVGVDATHFWFLRPMAKEIVRCPLAGCSGNPEVMATAPHRPTSLLVTDKAVYWATSNEEAAEGNPIVAAVWRLAK